MALRFDELAEILKLIDSSSCDEFVLETEGLKLVVRRRSADGSAPPVDAGRLQAAATAAPTSSQSSPVAAPRTSSRAQGPSEGMYVVHAPMVGTFYRSPSPGAPPFVEVGSRVKGGDPLGIIEVMKLFTTIYAERGGTVTEIGAANAEFVEYGQMLFVVAPG